MYVTKQHVTDFRCFRDQVFDWEFPGKPNEPALELPNVNLLLGVNGAGKTSALMAIALGVLAPVIRDSGYKPYYLIRRSGVRPAKKPCAIETDLLLHEHDLADSPTRLSEATLGAFKTAVQVRLRGAYEVVSSTSDALPEMQRGGAAHDERIAFPDFKTFYLSAFGDDRPACFLLGYGATRRTETSDRLNLNPQKQRGLRYHRVAGLFEDYVALWPLGAWLPKLESAAKRRHAEVVQLLHSLLPADTVFADRFLNDEPLFRQRTADPSGVELPFGALSDGYRAYVGLVSDMLYHLHVCCPKSSKLTDMTGVVLVDDIDLHLHPSWQRMVVPQLATTFPRLQFVLTSHSPLVAGTLHARNVRLVEGGQVRRLDERLHGLSCDQLLLSSYFGHTPPRSVAMERHLAELSDEVARSGDPKRAIAYLRELAGQENGQRRARTKHAPDSPG